VRRGSLLRTFLTEGAFMKKGEIIANFVIVLFFIFLFICSFQLRQVKRFGEVGSGFWPMLTLALAILLSLIMLLSNLIKYNREKKQTGSVEPTSAEAKVEIKNLRKKIALSMVFLLFYIIIMPWIGFILATFLYILGFILLLGERRKLVLILSPVLATALIVIIFAKFIAIPVPKGVGIFAALSRLVY